MTMFNEHIQNLPYDQLMKMLNRYAELAVFSTPFNWKQGLVGLLGEQAVRKGIANYYPRVNFS